MKQTRMWVRVVCLLIAALMVVGTMSGILWQLYL